MVLSMPRLLTTRVKLLVMTGRVRMKRRRLPLV